MIWSSNSPDAGATPAFATPPAEDWAWKELEAAPLGPEDRAAAKAAEESRHRMEVEAAYKRGVLDGRHEGAATARQELESAMRAVKESLESVRAQREAWAGQLEEDLVILAAAMASKIVDREIETDSEIFPALATKAIAAFPAEEPIRVRLNPADLDLLHGSGAVDPLTEDRSVRWIPDEETTRGGCIVEGPDKIMDGRVDEALRRIVRELTHG